MDIVKAKEYEEVLSDMVFVAATKMKEREKMDLLVTLTNLLDKYDESSHWYNVDLRKWEYNANEELSSALHCVLAAFDKSIRGL